MKIIYLSVLFCFTFCASFAAHKTPFEGWSPSAPGNPLNQTFFHRAKAKAPVFLEVGKSGSPHDVNFLIRRYPAASLPEMDSSATADAKENHREALRHTYLDPEQSCPIGTISLQFRAPESVCLVMFSVMSPYRGQNLGTHALLTALSMMKKRKNIRTVTLSIDKSAKNASGLADFYERLGFRHELLPGTLALPRYVEMWLDLERFDPNKRGIFKNTDKK